MRAFRTTVVALLVGLVASGCVVASPGSVPSPQVEVLGTTGPASQYGADATQIFDNPALWAKVRALFGPDFGSPNPIGLSAPAPAFFAKSSPPTMMRIDSADWIAVRGCNAAACATRHGLVLIGPGGDRLFARVEDRGFTKEYAYGRGMTTFGPRERALVDAVWRALSQRARSATRAASSAPSTKITME